MGRQVDLSPRRGIDFATLMRDVVSDEEPERKEADLATRVGEAFFNGLLRRVSEGDLGGLNPAPEGSTSIDRLVEAANKIRAMDMREREYQERRERYWEEKAERLERELHDARKESGGANVEMMRLLLDQQGQMFQRIVEVIQAKDDRWKEELRDLKEQIRERREPKDSEESSLLRQVAIDVIRGRLNSDPKQQLLEEREFWAKMLQPKDSGGLDPQILEIQLKHELEKTRLQYEFEQQDRAARRSEGLQSILEEVVRQFGSSRQPQQAAQAQQIPPSKPAYRIVCQECNNEFVMRDPQPIVRCPRCGESIRLEEEEDESHSAAAAPGASTPPVTGGLHLAQNPPTGGTSPNGRVAGTHSPPASQAVRDSASGVSPVSADPGGAARARGAERPGP